jgi:hypothetical protein
MGLYQGEIGERRLDESLAITKTYIAKASARQMQSHMSSIMSCGKARSRLPRTAPCVGAIGRTALWLALNSCVGSHSPHAARPLVRYKSRRGGGVRFDPGPKCASSPTARAARSPRRHLSSSGSAERLWSKDRAASPLHHRRSVGRLSARRPMRLKLVSAPNRFRGVVAEARNARRCGGRLALQLAAHPPVVRVILPLKVGLGASRRLPMSTFSPS